MTFTSTGTDPIVAKLEIESSSNDDYFIVAPQVADGVHSMNYRGTNTLSMTIDIAFDVNIEPLIGVPAPPYNEVFYYVIGATNNPANEVSRVFSTFSPSQTGKTATVEVLRQDTSAAIAGVTGVLATNGEVTVSINVADTNLAAKYDMKFKTTVGAYSD